MSAVWRSISQRFRHPPILRRIESPVATLPYDEAVDAVTSMIEQWKMEQPSLPDLEVLRSCDGSLSCADHPAVRFNEAEDEVLVPRLRWRCSNSHTHPSPVHEHQRRHSYEPIWFTCSTVRAALAVTLGVLFRLARAGYTGRLGGDSGLSKGQFAARLSRAPLRAVPKESILPHPE